MKSSWTKHVVYFWWRQDRKRAPEFSILY